MSEGLLSSVFTAIDRPGQIVRNVIKGRNQSALRHLGQLGLDSIDAFLPGDWLRNDLATEEDDVSGSDLVNIDREKSPWLATAADLGFGILTDPLTYTGFGPILKGLKAGVGGAKSLAVAGGFGETVGALEKVGSTASANVGSVVKDVMGLRKLSPEVAAIADDARSAEALANASGRAAIEKALTGVPIDERKAIFASIQNAQRVGGLSKAGGVASKILDEGVTNPKHIATEAAQQMLAGQGRAGGKEAQEIWMELQKETTVRGRIPLLEKALGLKGVAVPSLSGDVLEQVAKDPDRMFDLVFNPQWGDNAATATRNAAIPSVNKPGVFASGIDVSNQQMMGGAIHTAKPTDLIGGAAQAPLAGLTSAATKVANDALKTQAGITPGSVDFMLGVQGRQSIQRTGAEMASPLDVAIHKSGGARAPMEWVDAADLPELTDSFKYIDTIKSDVMRGLAAQGLRPDRLERLGPVVDQIVDMSAGGFKELVDNKVFSRPIGRDLLRQSPQYAQRAYSGLETGTDKALRDRLGSHPSAAKARSLDADGVVEFLNKNPDVTLEDDLSKVMLGRQGQQGRMIAQQRAASGLATRAAKVADTKMAKAAQETDGWQWLPESERLAKAGLSEGEQLAYLARGAPLFEPGGKTDLARASNILIGEMRAAGAVDDAAELELLLKGIAPRGALTNFLSKGNRIFKPFATAGAFIPRISFTVGNVMTGGLTQVFANKQARAVWPQYAKKTGRIIIQAIDDGIEHLTGKRMMADDMLDVKQALRNGGGTMEGALAAAKNPLTKEALQYGVVTDGFIDAEIMAGHLAREGWSKKWRDMRDWGSAIAGGSEKRMRFVTFAALREKGVSAPEAAKIISDTFFPYHLSGPANRTARDIIPFFQFSAKAIPQQLKLMAEKPWIPVGMASLSSAQQGQVYPYMEGNLNLPTGTDEKGNPEYLTSLRLPMEALGMIPNLSGDLGSIGRDLEREWVGSSQPLLKSAYGVITGREPFFGSRYGSYSKLPGNLEAGAAGRLYNKVAGTGLIQPLDTAMRPILNAFDDRRSTTEKLLNTFTGARVVSVDPDRAALQNLQGEIERNPEIQQAVMPYSKSDDPATQALLNAYRDARKNARKPVTDS